MDRTPPVVVAVLPPVVLERPPVIELPPDAGAPPVVAVCPPVAFEPPVPDLPPVAKVLVEPPAVEVVPEEDLPPVSAAPVVSAVLCPPCEVLLLTVEPPVVAVVELVRPPVAAAELLLPPVSPLAPPMFELLPVGSPLLLHATAVASTVPMSMADAGSETCLISMSLSVTRLSPVWQIHCVRHQSFRGERRCPKVVGVDGYPE